MLGEQEIKLRILEVVVPHCSKVGITKSENVIETCSQFEKYVLSSKQCEIGDEPESPPDFLMSQPKRRTGRRKKTDQTPLMVDKSN